MADVASSLNSWSTTASSNSPSGTTIIGTGLDDNMREIQAVVKTMASFATVASSTADPLSSTENAFVTLTHSSGTTAITDLGNRVAGIYRFVVFSISGGTLSLTHNASTLILPGGANITCADKDCALFVSTGTDAWKCIGYWRYSQPLENLIIACGDESTAITSTGQKIEFRMPYAMTLTDIKANLSTASSSGSVVVDVNQGGSTLMTTNKITIEVNEKTSKDATTQPALTTTALTADSIMTIDVDSTGSGAKGLKVTLIGRQSI